MLDSMPDRQSHLHRPDLSPSFVQIWFLGDFIILGRIVLLGGVDLLAGVEFFGGVDLLGGVEFLRRVVLLEHAFSPVIFSSAISSPSKSSANFFLLGNFFPKKISPQFFSPKKSYYK